MGEVVKAGKEMAQKCMCAERALGNQGYVPGPGGLTCVSENGMQSIGPCGQFY